MPLFSRLYRLVLGWSSHPYAPRYLAGLSFTEAAFFPVPPDVMLAPMTLSKPERAWYYATLAVMFSVLGGLLGYCLGFFAFEPLVKPIMANLGYIKTFNLAVAGLNKYGVWIMFVASFTPVPFKLFTIASGAAHMSLLPFVLTSLIGRGLRFFLVAGVVRFGGPPIEPYVVKYLDIAGWTVIFILITAVILIRIF